MPWRSRRSRPRFAAVALFVDQVIAVVTVTWAHGLSSTINTGYEFNLALMAMTLVIVGIGAGPTKSRCDHLAPVFGPDRTTIARHDGRQRPSVPAGHERI